MVPLGRGTGLFVPLYVKARGLWFRGQVFRNQRSVGGRDNCEGQYCVGPWVVARAIAHKSAFL